MSEPPIPAPRVRWGWIAVGALCAACCWWATMAVLIGVGIYKTFGKKASKEGRDAR